MTSLSASKTPSVRFDDHLIGKAQANDLSGGAGDDTLTGGGGADILNGGAGSDTADYSDATSGVTLTLAGGGSGGDTYISIENLAGSGFNDRLTGNGAANVLTGQGGADRIDGGGGDDTLLGDFAYQGDAPPRPAWVPDTPRLVRMRRTTRSQPLSTSPTTSR